MPKLVILISLLLFAACNKQTKIESINKSKEIKELDGKINRLNTLLFPDTTISTTIDSGISTFCFVPPNFLYYLDRNQKKVIVISTIRNEKIFSFSGAGRGPGEIKDIDLMKFIPDSTILILDNQLRRITLFNKNGVVKKTIKIPYSFSDVCMMPNEKLLTSSFELIPDYKPIMIFSSIDEKILSEFGYIIDPQKKLTERFNYSSFSKRNRSLLSQMSMAKMVLLPNGKEFIFSQKNPYYLLKYNFKTQNAERFDAPISYSTDLMDEIIMDEKKESTTWNPKPSARVMSPKVVKKYIAVTIFSHDSQNNFLDLYSLDGIFVKRLRIPPLDKGLKALIVDISPNLEIYVLVLAQNHFRWIERFKIDPAVFD